MTTTSYDLIQDQNGSVKLTFDAPDFDSALAKAIEHLGYQLQATDIKTESDLIEYQIINTSTGEVERELVSFSEDVAQFDALSQLGYSLYETLTEAELKSNDSFEDDDEDEAMIRNFEEIEEGKIVAFAGSF